MESHHPVECGCDAGKTDHGPRPFVTNVVEAARQNQNFRTAYWTGHHLQMTLMCIPVCGEIGVEMHPDTDQFIRVEAGEAFVHMGACRENLDTRCRLHAGDMLFVPGGTWHNVLNGGGCPVKLSSIYAPVQHPRGTVHHRKADAAHEHREN